MATFLVLHGPNLNLLGQREPELYGSDTLAEIDARLQQQAGAAGHDCHCFQSNGEHELVDRIQQAGATAGIVINAASLTHTSIALRDALLGVQVPFIEVHLSNIYARESYRHHSYLADAARGVICGLGWRGYQYALAHLMEDAADQ